MVEFGFYDTHSRKVYNQREYIAFGAQNEVL